MNVVSNSFSVFSGYSMGPKYSYRGWGLNIHTTPKFFLEILLCPWTAAWACTKTVGICALTFAGLLFLSPCPVGLIKRLRRRSGSAFGRPTMRLCPGSRWPPSPRPRACPSPRSKASWRLWSGTGVRNLASHLGDPVSCPKRIFGAFLTNHYGLFLRSGGAKGWSSWRRGIRSWGRTGCHKKTTSP